MKTGLPIFLLPEKNLTLAEARVYIDKYFPGSHLYVPVEMLENYLNEVIPPRDVVTVYDADDLHIK
jgi:hypothetical protein